MFSNSERIAVLVGLSSSGDEDDSLVRMDRCCWKRLSRRLPYAIATTPAPAKNGMTLFIVRAMDEFVKKNQNERHAKPCANCTSF